MIGKQMLWIGWTVVGVVVLQTTPISRLVYNPQAVEINNDHLVVYRSFPTARLGGCLN